MEKGSERELWLNDHHKEAKTLRGGGMSEEEVLQH